MTEEVKPLTVAIKPAPTKEQLEELYSVLSFSLKCAVECWGIQNAVTLALIRKQFGVNLPPTIGTLEEFKLWAWGENERVKTLTAAPNQIHTPPRITRAPRRTTEPERTVTVHVEASGRILWSDYYRRDYDIDEDLEVPVSVIEEGEDAIDDWINRWILENRGNDRYWGESDCYDSGEYSYDDEEMSSNAEEVMERLADEA